MFSALCQGRHSLRELGKKLMRAEKAAEFSRRGCKEQVAQCECRAFSSGQFPWAGLFWEGQEDTRVLGVASGELSRLSQGQ